MAGTDVVPGVGELEVKVAPSVQYVPDGGMEVLVELGEERVLEETSFESDGEEHVPGLLHSATVATLDARLTNWLTTRETLKERHYVFSRGT